MKTKRINWLLIGAAALAMGACSDEELMVEESTENGKTLFTFEATMDADTRTTFNADYSSLTWVEDDQLSFFTDAGDQHVASSKYVDGNRFKASLSSKTSNVLAIYPYGSVRPKTDYSSVWVTIPFNQIQKKAGVLNGANVPMFAQTTLSSGLPSLKFQPLASLIAFNVYHSGDGSVDKLKSVTYLNTSDLYPTVTSDIYFDLSDGLLIDDERLSYYMKRNDEFSSSGSVGLVTPYEIPRNKSNNKSGLVYLAVKSRNVYNNGTFIVTTDGNKAYYFTINQSLDLKDPYKTQTIAMDLAKADSVKTLDNLNSRFDDDNFLQFLLKNYDVNLDEKLSSFEVALVREKMDCSGLSIQSLKGIELFTNLEYLDCRKNQLTSLDVSGLTRLKYLYCLENQLTSLDVSGLTGLKYLNCQNNQLTSLDVSGCTGLEDLQYDRSKLISLNLSGCMGLTELDCTHGTLQSLNVSGCTGLKQLNCHNSQLTSLDASGCTGLTSLSCSYNQLTSLNVSGCTGLTSLSCSYNQLTSLDVSGCANAMTFVDATEQLENVTDKITFKFYKATGQTIEDLRLPEGAETIEK